MFDKKAYRAMRDAQKAGIFEKPAKPPLAKWTKEDHKAGRCGKSAIGSDRTSGVTMHLGKKGMFAVTRREKRQKVRNRSFALPRTVITGMKASRNKEGEVVEIKVTKEVVEDKVGTLLTRRHARHYENPEKNKPVKLPTQDPRTSNHYRNVERKQQREAARAAAR